jgi:hypothetical protein
MRASTRNIALGIASVVVVILVVLFTVGLGRARADARRVICVHNLKLLSISLRTYAEHHDGAFPDTWTALLADPQIGLRDFDYLSGILTCPEFRRAYVKRHGEPYRITGRDGVDARSTYVLVPGLHIDDDAHTILAYERGDNHGGVGHAVLHVEGSAWWIALEDEPIPAWLNAAGTHVGGP